MKRTKEQFVLEARKVHGDKFDYSNTAYTGNRDMVQILCFICKNIFDQTPRTHLKGSGCPACECMKRKDEFVKEANLIHKDSYDYSEFIYTNNHTKGIIIHKICGNSFLQSSNSHQQGHGCPKCYHINNEKKTTEEFIAAAVLIHGEEYTYKDSLYDGWDKPVVIFCKECNRNFEQAPYHHLRGSDCPLCSRNKGYSKQQIEWLNYIAHKDSIIIQHAENGGEVKIEGNKVDGYNKENKTVYEFHGDYWHGNPKFHDHTQDHPVSKKTYGQLFKDTLHKELKLKQSGYKYICIWEHQWNLFKKSLLKISCIIIT